MNYKQIYFNYYGYVKDDIILCEVCNAVAVDIHHIVYRSQGGTDDIDNLIALCRSCHNKAHNNELTKEQLFRIHELK